MRRLILMIPLAIGCAPSTASSAGDDGGDDGSAPPATSTCTGDPTACLSGTATTHGFVAPMSRARANLYRVFPSGTAAPLATQFVANDGTWAFSSLAAWGHYYVQIAADFAVDGGRPSAVGATVGPFGVPAVAGGTIAVPVEPVQLEILEGSTAGGYDLQWASAHVFDPATGDEIAGGANVAITVAGAATPMPWTTNSAGVLAYFVEFAQPVAAQPAYTITTSFGSSNDSWHLVADPPTFAGAIASPADHAAVPTGQPLVVSWPAQPLADYEVVELFVLKGSTWSATYASPQPVAADTTQETIPASSIPQSGQYLLEVAFSKSNCPVTADGCVSANAVASAHLTAQ